MAQITFENPIYLWLLFLIPIMVLLHFHWLRKTKRKAMKFANFQALKRVTGHKLITKNYFLLGIRLVLLFVLTLAAADMTYWYEGETNNNAFIIAIDTSASMRAQDIEPSRVEAAKDYAQLFVDTTNTETAFGIVAFSGVTFIEQTLTTDKSLIKDKIVALETIDAGGTDIAGAVITSTNLLANSEKGKNVILITDGSSTLETFASNSIIQGVTYAKENHVIVHTIGIGTDSGPLGYLPEYYNISSVYDSENLEYIANETEGQYHYVTTREDLLEAYTEIAQNSSISLIERSMQPILLLVFVILFFLELVLTNTRYRPLP